MKKNLISKILTGKVKLRLIDSAIDEAKAAILTADDFAQVTSGEKHREFMAHRDSIVQKTVGLFEKRSALVNEIVESVLRLDSDCRLSINEAACLLGVSRRIVERRYDTAAGLLGLILSSIETSNGGAPILLMSYLFWSLQNPKMTLEA